MTPRKGQGRGIVSWLDHSLAATVHLGDDRCVPLPDGFGADDPTARELAHALWSLEERAQLVHALRRALPVEAYGIVDVDRLADALIESETVASPGDV